MHDNWLIKRYSNLAKEKKSKGKLFPFLVHICYVNIPYFFFYEMQIKYSLQTHEKHKLNETRLI